MQCPTETFCRIEPVCVCVCCVWLHRPQKRSVCARGSRQSTGKKRSQQLICSFVLLSVCQIFSEASGSSSVVSAITGDVDHSQWDVLPGHVHVYDIALFLVIIPGYCSLVNHCVAMDQLRTIPENMLLFSLGKQSHKSCLPYLSFLLTFKGLVQPELIGGVVTLSVV